MIPLDKQVITQELVWYPLRSWAPAYDTLVLLWNAYAGSPIIAVLKADGWRVGEEEKRWDGITFNATFTHYATINGPDAKEEKNDG